MRLTRTNQWTAAGLLLLGVGLVAALSALLVPAGTDSLSALVMVVAVALAVIALSVGPGSLVRTTAGVIGAFALVVLPVTAVILTIAGVHLLAIAVPLQLALVVGGALFVVDLTRDRPARTFAAGAGLLLIVALAIVVGSPMWAPSPVPHPVSTVSLVGSGALAITSLLLGVVLLGVVRMIAVSEQSAYPAASEVTDR